ncbi:MAG: hypothetical protein R3B81_09280 [bacterium]
MTTGDLSIGGARALEPVARELQAALVDVLGTAVGDDIRQSALTRALALDKSLASRLARAVTANGVAEFLHYVPSPPGLNLMLEAISPEDISPEQRARVERAIVSFRGMLETLPGGRADLEAMLSDETPFLRERALRTAGQSTFRGVSAQLGYQCGTLASTLAVFPSATNPDALDALEMQHRAGVRRLRPTAAIGLMRIRVVDPAAVQQPAVVTIDRQPIRRADDVILRDFTDTSIASFDVIGEGDGSEILLALTEEQAALHAPLTVTSAHILREGFYRYRPPEGDEYEARNYLLNMPCRRVVRDIYLHDSCRIATPEFSIHLPGAIGTPEPRNNGLLGRVASVDVGSPRQDLGRGLRRAGIRGLPSYAAALKTAFERAGLDPGSFHGYRIDLAYPLPLVFMSWWVRLADRG